MRDVFEGIKHVFWNSNEGRLRSPFRLVAALLIFLFTVPLVLLFTSSLGWLFAPTGEQSEALLNAVSLIVAYLLLIIVVLAIAWFVDKRYLGDLGIGGGRQWLREAGVGAAVGSLMVGTIVLVAVLAGVATVDGTLVTREGSLFGPLSVPVGTVLTLCFFLVAGFLEELLFRGYLLVNVAEGLDDFIDTSDAVTVGVVVSAVLFGLVHAASPGASVFSLFVAILFGLLFGASYALTDRLGLPVGLHVAWNVALGPVFGLPVSGITTTTALVSVDPGDPAFVTGGEFGPEGGLVALLALAVGSGMILLWFRRAGTPSIQEHITKPNLWTQN